MKSIWLDNTQIELVFRRENRKSVRLKFIGNCCHIQVPYFLSDEKIEDVIHEKKSWILKAYATSIKIDEQADKNILLGQVIKLQFIKGKQLDYVLDLPQLQIYKSNRLSESSAYLRVKDMIAYDVILALLSEVAKEMKVDIKAISLKSLKASWGRCNSRKEITLSFKLIECKPEFIRYVCVHECAHILEMNHSPAFWSVVERFCPDYKNIKKQSIYAL